MRMRKVRRDESKLWNEKRRRSLKRKVGKEKLS